MQRLRASTITVNAMTGTVAARWWIAAQDSPACGRAGSSTTSRFWSDAITSCDGFSRSRIRLSIEITVSMVR